MDETEVEQIEAWVGLDVGKADHHATVVSTVGEPLFERSVGNDEAAIEQLLDRALEVNPCGTSPKTVHTEHGSVRIERRGRPPFCVSALG
jgi:Transposase